MARRKMTAAEKKAFVARMKKSRKAPKKAATKRKATKRRKPAATKRKTIAKRKRSGGSIDARLDRLEHNDAATQHFIKTGVNRSRGQQGQKLLTSLASLGFAPPAVKFTGGTGYRTPQLGSGR